MKKFDVPDMTNLKQELAIMKRVQETASKPKPRALGTRRLSKSSEALETVVTTPVPAKPLEKAPS
jgi:hypothetical protein